MNLFIERSLKGALSFMKESISSDEIARSEGLCQSMRTRTKLVLLVAALAAALCIRTLPGMAALYLGSLLLAARSGIAMRFFLKRTWLFIPLFALVIAVPAVVMNGIASGALFVLRIATCVSFVVLITVTTRHNDLLRSLRSVGVPAVFVAVLTMTYRYVFLLIGVFEEMHLSLKARLAGPMAAADARHWIASRIGYLFRRSLRMSEEVYMAMVARGYTMEDER